MKSSISSDGEKQKSRAEKVAIGNDCECGTEKYGKITLEFNGPALLPEEEASIGALLE